jgi:hypothetical protein
MSQIVTLELPDELAERARALVARTQQRVEDVLIAWLDQSATELPVELLADDEVLAAAATASAPSTS